MQLKRKMWHVLLITVEFIRELHLALRAQIIEKGLKVHWDFGK
jgi:hypothetical protein